MSEGHWVVNQIIAGHNLAFNMDTLITMWAAMIFLLVVAFITTRNIKVIPNRLQIFFEKIMGFFWGQADQMIGEQGRRHIPIIASLFLFIATANLMGQLPMRMIELQRGEFASPTNDINMTAALAIIVLIYYLVAGIKEKGIHFFYHGLSFPGIVMFLIDILDIITRPFSLALRLFCNIFVGEILVSVMMGICAYFLPLPVMFFEVFVALVQALVFMMLTIAYISMAVNEE